MIQNVLSYVIFLFGVINLSASSVCATGTVAPQYAYSKQDTLSPILIDKGTLSGLGLKQLELKDQPGRDFFQKNLYRGVDLSVYVVSSQSWPGRMDNFAIDEYIYMLNGKARVQPEGGEDLYFQSGEHFFAPKGYTGEWEIMAGDNYHYELSVITTPRADSVVKSQPLLPMRLDPNTLSGLNINFAKENTYQSTLVEGDELTICLFAEQPQEREITRPAKEHIICLLSGALTITNLAGQVQRFYSGDFLIVPAGFTGKWRSEGHSLAKWIQVERTN